MSLPIGVITGSPPMYTSKELLTSSHEAGLKTGMSRLFQFLSTNLLLTLSTSSTKNFFVDLARVHRH